MLTAISAPGMTRSSRARACREVNESIPLNNMTWSPPSLPLASILTFSPFHTLTTRSAPPPSAQYTLASWCPDLHVRLTVVHCAEILHCKHTHSSLPGILALVMQTTIPTVSNSPHGSSALEMVAMAVHFLGVYNLLSWSCDVGISSYLVEREAVSCSCQDDLDLHG